GEAGHAGVLRLVAAVRAAVARAVRVVLAAGRARVLCSAIFPRGAVVLRGEALDARVLCGVAARPRRVVAIGVGVALDAHAAVALAHAGVAAAVARRAARRAGVVHGVADGAERAVGVGETADAGLARRIAAR